MPTSPQPKPRHPAPAPGHGAPMAAAAVWARALRSRCARWGVIAPPYAWMALFFAVPFAIVLKISLSSQAVAMPPFTDMVAIKDGIVAITLNLHNFAALFEESVYVEAFLNAVRIAFVSTLLALLIGYPIAYAIAQMPQPRRGILLMLVILPSWTSFLIRIYAWMGLLKNTGLVNGALMWLGIIEPDAPLQILNTEVAVYIGIVYAYLPFMVLPLYAVLQRLDRRLLDASADLGAGPLTTFVRITLPLSLPGIISGSMLVFIPALGEFVIPELLGGSETLMIGKLLWQEFFYSRDWPRASAVAVVMLALILAPLCLLYRHLGRRIEARA